MNALRDDDRRVAAVITSSVVYGLLARPLGHLWRAAAGAVVVTIAARWANAWTGLDATLRRLAVGTMLVVAVAAHLVFTFVTQTPPGWLWLVMPGLFAGIGLLMILASGFPGTARR